MSDKYIISKPLNGCTKTACLIEEGVNISATEILELKKIFAELQDKKMKKARLYLL